MKSAFSLKIVIYFRVLKTRLNKKYPEAYASGKTLSNFCSCQKTDILFSVIEMHNQHDSLDDEDDDIVPPMVLTSICAIFGLTFFI